MLRHQIAGIFVAVTLIAPGFAETWQTKHGRSFEASLKAIQGEDLVFEQSNGRRFTMKAHDLDSQSRGRLTRSVKGSGGTMASVTRGILRTGNFDRSWPRDVRYDASAEVKLVREDKAARRYEYESKHYRFLSSVRLSDSVTGNFGVLFETTYQFCQQLPLSMECSGSGAAKSTILLLANEMEYVQAGGPPGSAGCYVQGRDLVLIPLSSLGVFPKAGGYILDRSKQNMVLVHELVHQLTPSNYFQAGARGWFSEGLAEYVAVSPYSWGYFQTDTHGRAVKAFVTGRGLKGKGGRALGAAIQAPALRDLMNMSYGRFSGSNASVNYATSLLCLHHFFHKDGQGRARRITNYLKALDEGKSGASAHSALLDGRSYEQVQAEIAAGWKAKGITIQFGR